MSISCVSSLACCGMDELSGFYGKNSSWLQALRNVFLDEYDDTNLPAVLIFSGSEEQISGGSPFAFAKWLRAQGEVIYNTRKVLNRNSGNKIQAFMWSPSEKFRARFESYNKKKDEKENNDDSSGDDYY